MRYKLFGVLALLILFNLSFSQYISYGTIEPMDQAYTDPIFDDFIKSLKSALLTRDIEYIYNILDDSIHYSFGGEGPGKVDFRRDWKLDSSNSEFWEAFSSTMNLGIVKCSDDCDYNDFVFPYYLESGYLKNLDDVFSVLIITSPNAKVYSSPNENSRVITTLKYIAISYTGYENGWFVISYKKNQKGYINDKDARELVGLRGGFKMKNNEWKLVYFVAGD